VPHVNTHALKEAHVIYEAYSAAGPTLLIVEVPPEDLNNYIHTKNPKGARTSRQSRDEHYAMEEEGQNYSPGMTIAKLYANDPRNKPRYRFLFSNADWRSMNQMALLRS
jgi:hypothetical protein